MGTEEPRPILVVEDDEELRWLVQELLSDEGYRVVTATDGAAALARLDEVTPRAIVLDMRMPVMDGWTFARTYRARPGPHAPIIVCTATSDPAARGAEVAAAAVVAKPFSYMDLLTVVRRVVGEARG